MIAAVLGSALWVTSASAHAELLQSTPEANAILDKSPVLVELLLSEPLEPGLSTVKVFDSDGMQVDLGDAAVDADNPERMTVSLPPLDDGIYSVSWLALSKIDGHGTAGSFPFAVGSVDASALPAEEQSSNADLPFSALVAKWLLLASAALLAGQFPSVQFIWGPALRSVDSAAERTERLSKNWKELYRLGSYGILLACSLGVLAQAGQAAGQELAAPWAKETIQIVTSTRLGVIWLIRMALALVGIWLLQSRDAKWKGIARFILGLMLLLSISLTSHAATELHPLLPILDDWLHLLGMSIWFGGLVHLITGLMLLRKMRELTQTGIASKVAARFSAVALPSVVVIGITGVYSATLRVGTASALFGNLYGDTFLIKQGVVAILLVIAGINFLVISPRLERDDLLGVPATAHVRQFRRSVLIETIVAGILLASVSLMTYLPPGRTPLPRTVLEGSRKVDDIRIALTISPGLVGQNTFTVKLTPKRSSDAVETVVLTFVPVQGNVPPSEFELTAQGNGIYTGQGANIGFPGRWLVEVAARRKDNFDAIVTYDFTISKPGSASASENSSLPLISAALLVLVCLLFGIDLFNWWRGSKVSGP